MTAYAIDNTANATLEVIRIWRWPTRSAKAPVSGADKADDYVRNPRNRPDANVEPPRSRMWKGAVGRSWNADRNTVNVNPHITKKCGVNSRSAGDDIEQTSLADRLGPGFAMPWFVVRGS